MFPSVSKTHKNFMAIRWRLKRLSAHSRGDRATREALREEEPSVYGKADKLVGDAGHERL